MDTFRIAPDFVTGVVFRGHVALFKARKSLCLPPLFYCDLHVRLAERTVVGVACFVL